MSNNVQTGNYGEELAARFLEDAGCEIIDRNWRWSAEKRRGEIDIVARADDVLVFVEVKTRRGNRFGSPLEAVTPTKQAQLHRLGAAYLRAVAGGRQPVRFDVIGVTLKPDGTASIQHIAKAF